MLRAYDFAQGLKPFKPEAKQGTEYQWVESGLNGLERSHLSRLNEPTTQTGIAFRIRAPCTDKSEKVF